MKTKTSI